MECANHPERTAEDLCLDCQKPLCLSCARRLSGATYCARCYVPRYRRARRVRGIALGASALAVAVGGYLMFERQKEANRERERYGRHRERVDALRSAVESDVCDRSSAIELADLLESTGHPVEAVEALAPMVERCPPDVDALDRLAVLQREVGDSAGALETAAKLIEVDPRQATGYSIRGAILADRGEPTALDDLRQAFELDPSDEPSALALARVLERRGDGCGAADVLDELLAVGNADDEVALRRRADALRTEGGCPRERIEGDRAMVPFERDSDVMIVEVRIDDRYDARMILDTGASSVAITRDLADRIGLDPWEGESFWVGTAGGVTRARRVRLDSVSLGGARVERVRAAVVPGMAMGDGIDGLLGNSFLSRFEVSVDASARRITLKHK